MSQSWQTIKIQGEDLLKRVKRLIHEGNVRRIVIKQRERTVAEFPITVGLVGAVAAPMLAALGAVAALLGECTIEVQREGARTPPAKPAAARKPARKPTRKAAKS